MRARTCSFVFVVFFFFFPGLFAHTFVSTVNLAECRSIDDTALNMIGSALPGVEDLCVYACLRLSDRGLVGLGSLESRLRRFCWAGAYKVCRVGKHRQCLVFG